MNLDAFWLLFIQDHLRNGLLTPLMVVVTMLGNKGIIWMVLIALLLWRRRTRWVGALAAVSFLVFVLLYMPCVAAVAAMRREMESSRWAYGTIAAQTALAWTLATLVFQLGRLLGLG